MLQYGRNTALRTSGRSGRSVASRVPTSLPSATSSANSGEEESFCQSARPCLLRSRRMRPWLMKTRLSGSRNEPGSMPGVLISWSVNEFSRGIAN